MAYTTIAKVRNRNSLFASNPPDQAITEFIADADGLIDGLTGKDWGDTPPAMIAQLSTDLAAYYAISYSPSAFASNSEAALTADMFWAAATRALTLLADKRVLDYLENL
jgi:hypothetical protein